MNGRRKHLEQEELTLWKQFDYMQKRLCLMYHLKSQIPILKTDKCVLSCVCCYPVLTQWKVILDLKKTLVAVFINKKVRRGIGNTFLAHQTHSRALRGQSTGHVGAQGLKGLSCVGGETLRN